MSLKKIKNPMKRLHIVALLFISLTTTALCYADNRADTFTVTLGGGDLFFAAKRHIENTSVPFAALGYNFTDRWGIEGLLGFFNTNFRHAAPSDRQINGMLVSVDGLYHFAAYKNIMQPFLLAGIGVIGLNPNRTDATDEGNINGGAGLQFFIDKSIALHIEARDFYTWVGGKNDAMVDGGITFLFG